MWKKLKVAVCEPRRAMISLWMRSSKLLPDKLYLSVLFRLEMGYWINWKSPQTFSEKLQWLKLYNRKPEYTQMVDKFAVKEYVAKLIGEEYIIPTLGVWDRFEDIDFDTLPNQFVLKTTHGGGGGGVVICKDKATFNREEARKRLQQSLDSDIYRNFREWPYKHVHKRIIAEKYMVDESGVELKDYKFFCFNGEVKCFKVDFDRFIAHRANYYDRNACRLPFGEVDCCPDFSREISLPDNLNEMRCVAEKVADGYPFIRVDLYNINGQIYFGEMTFFPAAGFGRFEPEEWDLKLGELIEINN